MTRRQLFVPERPLGELLEAGATRARHELLVREPYGADGVDTVEVNGGNGAEVFTATANGARVRFDRVNPAPFSIDIGTSEKLVVDANGGDDSFSASGNLAVLIAITVDGGAGNDTLRGGNGVDFLLGGDGNDFIDGNQGETSACSEPVTRPSSGTRVTATTPSRGRMARTQWRSTGAAPTRTWTCPLTASGSASCATLVRS